MMPSFAKHKEEHDKWEPANFYSPKNLTDSKRTPLLIKEPKARKNSEGVNGSPIIPSFLFKKSKKPEEED
jgi:hypothetical protein